MLPDFLIIGAAKSATTWLAARLDTHPGIHISRTEIHYFSRHHARPIAWYEAHFQAIVDEGLLGENSNTYLYTEEAPRRIQRALPEVRLVCVLRNPTERAYSGYCMQFEKGRVTGRIEDYLEPDSGGSVGGVDGSRRAPGFCVGEGFGVGDGVFLIFGMRGRQRLSMFFTAR